MLSKFFCCHRDNSLLDNENNEQTLIIIRGDIISRGLLGNILTELEKQFSLVAIKTVTFNIELIYKLYGAASSEDFYPNLVTYLMTGFHVALVIEGENVVERMVALKGKSPQDDEGNTLRKMYGLNNLISSIHCSHNLNDARREIPLFFNSKEIRHKIPPVEEYVDIPVVERRELAYD